MKKRIPSASSISFGLIAWLESTRIALPLKGVECRFEVTGNLANVELDQIYHQSADQPLDCTYTFPLPAGAAVYRCELHVNGRVIRAKVEEKQVARRIYEEQKAAGHRAALVETERENLFTLSLGNVQPDDLIVVRFAWFSVLDRTGNNLRLLVPTCPGVRYIPGNPLLRGPSGNGTMDDTDQVPDASRISPPRIDALHPDAAYFSIEGRLAVAEVDCGAISSPSHSIRVRESETLATIALSSRATVPDQDFVLTWRESKVAQLAPQSWHWTEGDTTYALVQLRAPAEVAVSENFEQDVYFLVDRSGSMAGAKWDCTCEALHAFVGLLGADGRVWITVFESSFRDFAETPIPAPRVAKDRGFQSMKLLGTAGGTELLPAAKHILQKISRHSEGRHVSVILITDGEVGNETAILDAFRKSPQIRVHAFGIDTAVNDAFLKSLARQHRGGCWLQTPDDDIAGTIAALGDRLRRPVLTSLSVSGEWESGSTTIPDLHADEVATVSLRSDVVAPLEVTGMLPGGGDYHIPIERMVAGSEAVKMLWARERITTLLDADRQAEAIDLAREYNLVCEGAAFIAWDEAEQVAIAEETLVQPSMEYCLKSTGFDICASHADSRADYLADSSDDTLYGDYVDTPTPSQPTPFRWLCQANVPTPKRSEPVVDVIRRCVNSPVLQQVLEARFQNALSSPPDVLARWVKSFRIQLWTIQSLAKMLEDTGAPSAVIEPILEWVLEAEDTVQIRLGIMDEFLTAICTSSFSSAGSPGLWQKFLERNFGVGSGVFAVAAEWLPEIRDSLPNEAPA